MYLQLYIIWEIIYPKLAYMLVRSAIDELLNYSTERESSKALE